MSHNMEAVEATRARFRPERITTLFVGESAPDSGDFFYYGNNAMLGHMQRVVDNALGESGDDFLTRFKAYGWYLDDLGACLNSRCSMLGESDSTLGYEQVFSPLEYRSDTASAAECAGLRAERPCLAVYR